MQPSSLCQLPAGTGKVWGSMGWASPDSKPHHTPSLGVSGDPQLTALLHQPRQAGQPLPWAPQGPHAKPRDSLRAGPARSSLGRWAPGLGERAARVTHSLPGARWPHPCSSANRGPPAPHQGPRAAGAGRGAGEQNGLPSSCEPAGAGGRAEGARTSPAQPDRPPNRPVRVSSGGESGSARPGQARGTGGRARSLARARPLPSHQPSPLGRSLPGRPGQALRQPRHSLRGHVASCRPRGHAVGWQPGGGPRLQGIPASPSRGPLPPRTRVGGLQEGQF